MEARNVTLYVGTVGTPVLCRLGNPHTHTHTHTHNPDGLTLVRQGYSQSPVESNSGEQRNVGGLRDMRYGKQMCESDSVFAMCPLTSRHP
jgi:hypothetical protein